MNVRFKDLSLFLKLAAIGGFAVFVIYVIAFMVGFFAEMLAV
jgi:hypothetical protein